jgi:hypothetical protein
VTTPVRRLFVFFGALGWLALALVLAVDAAATPATTQSGRKRRAALGPVAEEFQIQPAAWLTLRPVWLPPSAAEKRPAPWRLATRSVILDGRSGDAPAIVRGAHGSANIPKFLPPFTGPASPIR